MGKNKKNKAFTLVELMVVIAILAILATVSIIGYKSYIKRERVNSTITEATQAREVLISKIVANKEGSITIPFDGGSTVLTYVSGELNITTIPSEIEFIGTFDENIRKVFPELLNLPGLFTVKGNDIFYHYNREYIGEASLTEIGFDVIVNVRTLDSVIIEKGYEGGNPYDSSVTITLDQFNMYLSVGGESKTIGFNVSPEGTPYHWDSANPSVATVSQDGTVTPVGVGKTTVYITAGGQMKVVTVTVAPKGRTPVAVPAQSGRLIYDLSDAKQIPKWINFKYTAANVTADATNPDKLTIISSDGKVKLTITQQSRPNTGAGEEPYIALFELTDKENTCWADNFSTTDKTIYWRINKISIPIPYQSTRLEFDDFKDLYPTFGNFSPTNLGKNGVTNQYDVGASNGIIKITDASYKKGLSGLLARTNKPGPYSTTFTIIEEKQAYYIWEDGDINASKSIPWVVSKKTVRTPKFKPGVRADYDYIPNTMVGPGANVSIEQINTLFDFDSDFCKIIDARSADGLIQANYVGSFRVKFSIDVEVDLIDIIREIGGGFKVEDFYEWEKGTPIDDKGNAYLEWRINAAEIPTPWIEHNTFEYDSTITSRALDTLDSTYKNNYANCFKVHVFKQDAKGFTEVTAAKEVGTYKLSFELTDSNVRWRGHDQSDRTFPLDTTFTITPQMTDFNIEFDDTKAVKYDGNEHKVLISQFKNAAHIEIDEETTNKKLDGTLSATNVSDNYKVYVKPTGNYIWRDTNNAEPRAVIWKIKKATVAKPVEVTPVGSVHTHAFDTNDYYPITNSSVVDTDSYKKLVKITGDLKAKTVKATEDGVYTVKFEIENGKNCEWEGGGSDPITIKYKITPITIAKPSINSAYTSTYNSVSKKYEIPGNNSTITPFSTWVDSYDKYLQTPIAGVSGKDKADLITAKFIINPDYVGSVSWTGTDGSTEEIDIAWSIVQKQLSLSISSSVIEYTNSNIDLSNYYSVTGGTASDYSVTIKKDNSTVTRVKDIGDYVVTFAITNNTYVWAPNTASTVTFKVRTFVDPPENNKTKVYNGSSWTPYNGNTYYSITTTSAQNSVKSATNAGSYFVMCSFDSSTMSSRNYVNRCVWSDTKTNTERRLDYTITKASIDKPTVKGSLEYTGKSQTAGSSVFDNFPSSDYATVSGNTGTNVGEYTAVFTLTSNARWSDNSTGTVSLKWNITKPKASFSRKATGQSNLKYNGSAQNLINTGNSSKPKANNGTIYYKVDNGAYSTNYPQATNAGTYTISYYVKSSNTNNYADSDVETLEVTINKADQELSATSLTFDGKETQEIKLSTGDGNLSVSDISDRDNKFNDPTVNNNSSPKKVSVQCTSDRDSSSSHSMTFKISVSGTDNYNSLTENITATLSKKSSTCVTGDTLITLEDGSTKQIKDIEIGENVIAFNHETGKYESVPVLSVDNHGYGEYDLLELNFDDETKLRLVEGHSLFDLDLNKYVDINVSNYEDYIGHKFVKYTGNNDLIEYTTLKSVKLTHEYSDCWGMCGYKSLSVITNNMLSVPSVNGIFNYFEYGSDLRYKQDEMNADIAKYGLSTYEEWASITSEHMFDGLNYKYCKVAIGKGLATMEDFVDIIEILEYLTNSK